MIRVLCFLLVASLPAIVFPQANKLSLDDAVNPLLRPRTMAQLDWRGTNSFAYVEGKQLMTRIADEESTATVLLTLDQLNEALPFELRGFPPLSWHNANTIRFMAGPQYWQYQIDSGKAEKLSVQFQDAAHSERSPAGHLAFVKGYNLYICKKGSDSPAAITFDGNREIVYGEPAHRVEFGIRNGSYWSPSGQKLAFYRIDQQMVTDYPIVKYDTKPARHAPVKYPMAGEASHNASIGVYNAKTDEILYLKTGQPAEQYLTNITWTPDDSLIYVAVLNRGQDHLKLNIYDATSGEFLRTVFEEKHEKYVEPEHGPIFLPGQQEEFLWFSERDGYNHLYRYDQDGNLLGQVTQGEWEVTEFLGFDEKGKRIYYMSTEGSPIERQAWSLKLSNSKRSRLTHGPGMHTRVKLSGDGAYLLDTWSSLEVPGVNALLATKKAEVLDTLFLAANPLKNYTLGKTEIFSLQAEDGTDLYCRMIKPTDFDPAKKYPVMVYLYGGPHAQLVQDRWLGGARLFFQYMAQRGYVVFTLDNRGSPYRGMAFEQAVYRRMGTQEIADQLVGIEFLKNQSFVDADRIGIYGWSYGGYMATSMTMRNPGMFKAAVAGGPVVDWKFYEVMYTERYMDSPQENPEGYEEASLLNYVENLDGRLLVIHGLQDSTVVPQHTRALLRKAVETGKYIDYYPYPNHEHNVRGPERAHLIGVISRYFDTFLK